MKPRKPPPTPKTAYAIPTRLNPFGRNTADLSSLLMRGDLVGAAEECASAIADQQEAEEVAEDRLYSTRRDERAGQRERDCQVAGDRLETLCSVRDLIARGRGEDALALLTRDSFNRNPMQMQAAYRAAMKEAAQ